MSEISPKSVLAKSTIQVGTDMAKIQLKSDNINPFGGLFSILNIFNRGGLRSVIDRPLGRRGGNDRGGDRDRSVKTSHHTDPSCNGTDGNKKIKGRKEHIVVDTLGLPMSIAVHEANLHDSKGAPKAVQKLEHKFPRLKRILADGGYQGSLGDWVAERFGWDLEVVLRPDDCPSRFPVLPKRWIVERSFAWLENFRRLSLDYEYLAETAEAIVQLAFSVIMLNKFFQ